jgi:hypothetical protein
MNMKEALLDNSTHDKSKVMEVAAYAASSKQRFKMLVDCFLSDDYRLSQRGAWAISWAARANPSLVTPYIPILVEQLGRTDVHDAIIRNSVRILQDTDIPEALHGEVMNACFGFIEKPSTPAAIKAFSLTTLYNLSKIYPEIKAELTLIIEDRMPHETAAFKSRGKKILQQLK